METHAKKVIREVTENAVPCNLTLGGEWLEQAKNQKQAWVHATDVGDVPPTVFIEKDGKHLCTVVATQVDKHMGLYACRLLKKAFDPDFVTLMLDAHMTISEGKSKEEEERILEKYVGKPGSMQKACDEEGACALGEITDCINVLRVDREGNIAYGVVSYDYHGKGTTLEWTDHGQVIDEKTEKKPMLSGLMPEALREIMLKEKPIWEDEGFPNFINKNMDDEEGLTSKEKHHRIGRAMLSILVSQPPQFFALIGEELAQYGQFAPGIEMFLTDEFMEKHKNGSDFEK